MIKTRSTPPGRGYGEFIAGTTYRNGDVEMICSDCIEFIPNGSEPTGIGSYYYRRDAGFISVFQRYVDSCNSKNEESYFPAMM